MDNKAIWQPHTFVLFHDELADERTAFTEDDHYICECHLESMLLFPSSPFISCLDPGGDMHAHRQKILVLEQTRLHDTATDACFVLILSKNERWATETAWIDQNWISLSPRRHLHTTREPSVQTREHQRIKNHLANC